ncbi:D-alanyl-D-alanine carboxypeptidase/D-alanyl-D-alanine-endopeptidase [Nocardia carnea]|uniref:D-alanyl-D-alanine carboxypeptidase/D-alanyl-D-alanine-endopeptidase n=1 Tax=Nocardia carnea TaxID=37328 RepID=UPI00245664F4|nr:D-alanyl-D-alanine carboxypeptidase [Nocardia carnea]
MNGTAGRRRRGIRAWVITVLVGLLGAAAVVAAVLQPWTPEFRHGGLTIAAPPAPVDPVPEIVPAPETGPAPSPAGVAAALGPVAANPDLGGFAGSVTDAATGTVLWNSRADEPRVPSSTAKIMTAAAALLTLPADQRVQTRVVAGAAPNEIVLVAGGDPTLTAQPGGDGYYPGAAGLTDLADQVRSADVRADTVVVDISRYSGATMARGWEPADIGGGSIAPLEPVMLDGGRLDPLVEYSPRSGTPALDVGRRLATELGLDPARVRIGTAPQGTKRLAEVASAPLRDRLRDMMVYSDNVLAETIGREVAQATGRPASFEGAAAAVAAVLTEHGFDLTGVTMFDCSGLSTDDRIPARVLDRILATAAGPGADEAPEPTTPKPLIPPIGAGAKTEPADPGVTLTETLVPLLDYLPVAGGTGSLTSRYVTQNQAGAGWVRAKTGTLSVASTLAGYVLDRDGRVLTFTLMSSDRPPEVSRPALDAVATTLRNCGCS